MAPKGAAWEAALRYWQSLPSDAGATYDKEVVLRAEDIAPTVRMRFFQASPGGCCKSLRCQKSLPGDVGATCAKKLVLRAEDTAPMVHLLVHGAFL